MAPKAMPTGTACPTPAIAATAVPSPRAAAARFLSGSRQPREKRLSRSAPWSATPRRVSTAAPAIRPQPRASPRKPENRPAPKALTAPISSGAERTQSSQTRGGRRAAGNARLAEATDCLAISRARARADGRPCAGWLRSLWSRPVTGVKLTRRTRTGRKPGPRLPSRASSRAGVAPDPGAAASPLPGSARRNYRRLGLGCRVQGVRS